jgi:hypothetical protein
MERVGSGCPFIGPEPDAGISKSTAKQTIRDWMHRCYKNSSSPHLDRTIQKVVSLGTQFCKNYGAIRACEKSGFNDGRTAHRTLLLEMILTWQAWEGIVTWQSSVIWYLPDRTLLLDMIFDRQSFLIRPCCFTGCLLDVVTWQSCVTWSGTVIWQDTYLIWHLLLDRLPSEDMIGTYYNCKGCQK